MTAIENSKYKYNFNIIQYDSEFQQNYSNYETILILCSFDDFTEVKINLKKVNITIPDNIITIYKGDKGECICFYIGNIKYVLMKFPSAPLEILKMSGIIGKQICNTDSCEPVSLLVILFQTDLLYVSALLQGVYRYEHFKTGPTQEIKIDFYFLYKTIDYTFNSSIMDKIIKHNLIQYEIRDLINAPVNILNSTTYYEYINKNLQLHIDNNQNYKLDIHKSFTKDELKEFGLILAVNQGSKQEPKLIVLDYNPEYATNKESPICLVGKGVMFDTGGINLKHGDFSDMKTDMAGTAIIYGVMKSLALYQCTKRVIGILPLVQNDIGENAIHPGDVIKSYSGKTVEISDTDAEGRLILADCLTYAQEFKPSLIIDIATLTGQVGSIFGGLATAIMGNDQNIIKNIIESGSEENEKIWQLPLWSEYVKATKSKIADLVNHSNVGASTIMGGAFLKNFVPDTIPWVHLDIAGVSFNENDTPTKHAGATGAIFNTLVNYLINNTN
jgi:leucyl aminopeptidase